MKKLFNLICIMAILSFSQAGKGQNLSEGFKDIVNIKDIVGTWQWQSGDTLMVVSTEIERMNLRELISDKAPDIEVDVLLGWHDLSIGKKSIQNSLNKKEVANDNKHKHFTIAGYLANGKINIVKFTDIKNNSNPMPGQKHSKKMTGNLDRNKRVTIFAGY